MVSIKLFAGFLNWPLQVALGQDVEVVRFDAGGQQNAGLSDPRSNEVERIGGERRRFGLITTTPMGVFSVILQVSFLGGLALSLPFILYFVGKFVAPGTDRARARRSQTGVRYRFFFCFSSARPSVFTILIPASLRASIFF